MLYNMYIYNRKGRCLYYREWNRPLRPMADALDEEKRLVFGMLFSLKDLLGKMSHVPSVEGLHTLRTNAFALHHFQSVTGLVFVANTDADAPDLYANLRHIYSNIFIDSVSRNILCRQNLDTPLDCPLFEKRLEEYVAALPCFAGNVALNNASGSASAVSAAPVAASG